jgi:hypothetical protein
MGMLRMDAPERFRTPENDETANLAIVGIISRYMVS